MESMATWWLGLVWIQGEPGHMVGLVWIHGEPGHMVGTGVGTCVTIRRAWPHGNEDWRGINGEPGHMIVGSGVDIWRAWPHDGGDGIRY